MENSADPDLIPHSVSDLGLVCLNGGFTQLTHKGHVAHGQLTYSPCFWAGLVL